MSQTKAQLITSISGGVGNGTAAAPALTGDDTDTGISFGTSTVTTSTGGSARTTVDSSGRLLVGTSTARNNFFNSSIGGLLQLETSTTSTRGVTITNTIDSDASSLLVLAKSRGTAVGANGIVSSGDHLATISFQGDDGSEFVEAARIAAYINATPGANDMPGRLVFETTANGASTPTERVRITQSGQTYFGTTSSIRGTAREKVEIRGSNGEALCISSNAGTYAGLIFRDQGSGGTRYIGYWENSSGTNVGAITHNGSNTTYATSSDYRLKENVVDLDGAITRVKQLSPRRFNFIANPELTVDGFLAHEAQAVVPEAVIGTHNELVVWQEGENLPDGVSPGDYKLDEDGNTIPKYQGIDQSKLVPLLTAALQEAIGKIETLEATNTSQAATIAALDARLTALEGH